MIKEHFAKVISGLSVPPVMVSVLILILAFHRNDIFRDAAEIVIMMVLLGFVPVLAYVLSDLIPAVRAQGRDGQRKLAFVTNLVGYSCALLWAIITNVDKELLGGVLVNVIAFAFSLIIISFA